MLGMGYIQGRRNQQKSRAQYCMDEKNIFPAPSVMRPGVFPPTRPSFAQSDDFR